MKNRSIFRGMTVALLSAATLIGIAGCTTSKMMSKAQPTDSADTTPKKEYQWQDMSQGKNFYGKPRQTAPPQ
jgi:hypothetical protein